MARRLFVLDEEIVERIQRSAADAGKGGWQSLCASIMECEITGLDAALKSAKLDGIDMAIETLQTLRDAESVE